MKKGLSVLLILAALFGFYGGAVNLNDVLACKDYWEEEGERSTADLNKLEDGLNQLKDNEQAYLDGLDAVAEGEDALAQGEQDYADGQATLAKGEADYAAAPAKLRAGEKKLAAGKAAIAKGEKDLASLNTLIDGIEQVLNGYPEWKNGYEQLRQGRIDTLTSEDTKASVEMITNILTSYATAGNQMALKAAGDMGAAQKAAASPQQDPKSFTNDQYDGFNKYLNATVTGLQSTDSFLKSVSDDLDGYVPTFQEVATKAITASQLGATTQEKYEKYQADQRMADEHPDDEEYKQAAQASYEEFVKAKTASDDAQKDLQLAIGAVVKMLSDDNTFTNIKTACNTFLSDKTQVKPAEAIAMLTALKSAPAAEAVATYAKYSGTMAAVLDSVSGTITQTRNTKINGTIAKANQWIGGYAQITDPSGKAVKGQKTLVGGVDKIIGGVLDSKNDELISGMNKAAAAAGFTPKDFTPAASSKLAKDMASGSKLENFYNDMNKIEDGFKKVLPALKNKASDGAKTLKAGKKQVKAGQKELNQGYADYKAAPGKLAAGRAALAEGLQKLMDGRKELAAGKDKLAEYEDGEQQVRDGLATLMGTEANGGLDSILDRRSGDDDFDNGDEHLDLDEGLDAVDVGRGYQADSGELITKEITNRAIGTAAGLGAGALAVLAAILSFLKKNKGSGVCALLSAAAGGAGIAAGTSAGTEFSSIAGSAVGATPWIAFGILAAVAAVHAIAHFASKEA